MKMLAAIVTVGMFLAFSLAPASAGQDGKRKEGPPDGGEKKAPPREGEKKGPPPGDRKCGCDAGGYEEDLKKRGIGKDECERATKEHFKKHPDGVCHCFCNHDDGPKPSKKPGPPPDDGPKPPKKPGPPPGDGEKKKPIGNDGDGEKKPVKCCCDADGYYDNLKRKGYEKDECERITKEHFKKHPDGICHCSCSHDDGPRPPKKPGPPPDGDGEKKPIGDGDGGKKKCGHDCGSFKEELKRRGFGNDDQCDKHAKDHFKSHADGVCHCFCSHDDDGGKEPGGKGSGGKESGGKEGGSKDNRKGNNGVGNGQDPQPPGKPPVNDGPGTGPGNPGNKKGGGEKGGGK